MIQLFSGTLSVVDFLHVALLYCTTIFYEHINGSSN